MITEAVRLRSSNFNSTFGYNLYIYIWYMYVYGHSSKHFKIKIFFPFRKIIILILDTYHVFSFLFIFYEEKYTNTSLIYSHFILILTTNIIFYTINLINIILIRKKSIRDKSNTVFQHCLYIL